jgi:hypothetical protein
MSHDVVYIAVAVEVDQHGVHLTEIGQSAGQVQPRSDPGQTRGAWPGLVQAMSCTLFVTTNCNLRGTLVFLADNLQAHLNPQTMNLPTFRSMHPPGRWG